MGGEIRSFRDLIAWQKAMALARLVYKASTDFPDSERFGLVPQIRRAAVSIPSNIAEGYGRRRTQEYIRFLDIAKGSLCEVETQMILAHDLGMVKAEQFHACEELIRECDRVLH